MYLDYTPLGEQDGFVVMLEQKAGCSAEPTISYLNVSDTNDNAITHTVGAPPSDSFEAILGQPYEYIVDQPNEYVRVMKIVGDNIGQISADVPFTVSHDCNKDNASNFYTIKKIIKKKKGNLEIEGNTY